MSYRIRRAKRADLAAVLPMSLALNAHEGIRVDPKALESALDQLLVAPAVGGVWLVVDLVDAVIGYAIVTFGYDLEFAGRDAWLTELWVEEQARARGAGRDALVLLEGEVRALGVRALHLQVRPDNPARKLYERAGFTASPRVVMTKLLVSLVLLVGCQKSAPADDNGPDCRTVTAHIAEIMRQGKGEMGKVYDSDVANCEQRKLSKEKRACLLAAQTVEAIAACHAGNAAK